MVSEEMPAFPEKESSLLSKLKKKKPQTEDIDPQKAEKKARPTAVISDGPPAAAAAKVVGLEEILNIFY